MNLRRLRVLLAAMAVVLLAAAPVRANTAPYGWPEGWSAPEMIATGLYEHGYRVATVGKEHLVYWIEDNPSALAVQRLPGGEIRHLELPQMPAPGEYTMLPGDSSFYWIQATDGQWHLMGAGLDYESGRLLHPTRLYTSGRRLRDLNVASLSGSPMAVWSEHDGGALQIRMMCLDDNIPITVDYSDRSSRMPHVAASESYALIAWADQRFEDDSIIRVGLVDESLETLSVESIDRVVFSDELGRPHVSAIGGDSFIVTYSGGYMEDGVPTDRSGIRSRVITHDTQLELGQEIEVVSARGTGAVHFLPRSAVHGSKLVYAWSQRISNPRFQRTDIGGHLVRAEMDASLAISVVEKPELITFDVRRAHNVRVSIDEEGEYHFFWSSIRRSGYVDIHYTNTREPADIARWNILGIDAQNPLASGIFQVLLAGVWSATRMLRDVAALILVSLFLWIVMARFSPPTLAAVPAAGLIYSIASHAGILSHVSVDFWGMQIDSGVAIASTLVTAAAITVLIALKKRSGMLSSDDPLSSVGYLVLWAFWFSYFQMLSIPLALR